MRHAGDILATKPQTLRPRHTEYRRMTRHVKEKEKEEEEEEKKKQGRLNCMRLRRRMTRVAHEFFASRAGAFHTVKVGV